MRFLYLVLGLGTWIGWFALSRWSDSLMSTLDSIHPHLADIILVVSIIAIIILTVYHYNQNSDKKKAHSRDLAKSFEILSKGEFVRQGRNYEFCVPYPYAEFQTFDKLVKYPTTDDFRKVFAKENIFDKKNFDFVTLDRSADGEFQDALSHIRKYKKIERAFELARQTRQKFDTFCIENKINSDLIHIHIAKEHGFVKDDLSDMSIYPQFNELIKKMNDALDDLQKSLSGLSWNLSHGDIISGKCSKC